MEHNLAIVFLARARQAQFCIGRSVPWQPEIAPGLALVGQLDMGLLRAGALRQRLGSDRIGPMVQRLRRTGMEQYVGLDVSLEQTSVCVVDGSGKTLWQGKCASTPEDRKSTRLNSSHTV